MASNDNFSMQEGKAELFDKSATERDFKLSEYLLSEKIIINVVSQSH